MITSSFLILFPRAGEIKIPIARELQSYVPFIDTCLSPQVSEIKIPIARDVASSEGVSNSPNNPSHSSIPVDFGLLNSKVFEPCR